MKPILLLVSSLLIGFSSLSLKSQTSNGTPLANYMACLQLEQTRFDDDCLAKGHRASLFVTNRCDQSLKIEYRFSGSFVAQNSSTSRNNNVEHDVKPGSRVRLYHCYTAENSGQIEIVRVSLAGSSAGNSSNSSSSGSASGGGGSSSGGYNQTNSNTSSSGNSPRQATSLEEIRRRQAAAQNRGNSSSGSQRSAAEVQREQIRRQQQRQSNSGSSAKKSSSSASSGGNSSARRSSTNTRAEQQHKYRQQEQRAQAQREQQALAQRQHQEAMAQLGVAAILVHLTLGYLIYEQAGDVNGRESAPRGNGVHHQLSAGYNLSYFDLLNENIDLDPITIDLGLSYRLNLLQADNFGLGLRADMIAGHSLLFDTRFEIGYGANAYLGHKNFRFYSELQNIRNTLWMTEEENPRRWRWHRLSLGPMFSWNGDQNHLKFLYNWDYYHTQPALVEAPPEGWRIEFTRRNRIKIFAGAGALVPRPARRGRAGVNQDLGAFYYFGVHRSWDWHKPGSLDYDYTRLRRMNYEANLYLSVMNPVLEWGEFRRGDDRLALNGPQLSFNFITFEAQMSLYEDLYWTAGVGLSSLRRLEGDIDYAERSASDPYTQLAGDQGFEFPYPEPFFAIEEESTASAPSRAIIYSYGELEFPLGLHYYFPTYGTNRFWAAAKMVPAINLGFGQDEDLLSRNQALENPYNSFQLFYKFGLGVDLPYTSAGNLRWGLYYLYRPNSIAWENIDQNLQGLQLQMAYGF